MEVVPFLHLFSLGPTNKLASWVFNAFLKVSDILALQAIAAIICIGITKDIMI